METYLQSSSFTDEGKGSFHNTLLALLNHRRTNSIPRGRILEPLQSLHLMGDFHHSDVFVEQTNKQTKEEEEEEEEVVGEREGERERERERTLIILIINPKQRGREMREREGLLLIIYYSDFLRGLNRPGHGSGNKDERATAAADRQREKTDKNQIDLF